MTLRRDVRRFITECGEDGPQEPIPHYIVKRFKSWEAEELVALGTMLILRGAETEPKLTMHVTCNLHVVLHTHNNVPYILENVDPNASLRLEGY